MNTLTTNSIDASATAGTVTLILGGVRSGKSRFAQELATRLGGDDVLFVATAEQRDDEMTRRIDHHRRSRPSEWKTLESPFGTGAAIAELDHLPSVVLVDCLTLLVSNVMCHCEPQGDGVSQEPDALEARVLDEVDALIDVAAKQSTHLVIVSGEVGMGIVPDHAMGRTFRDLLGFANQRIAASATATYCMLAGLAVNVSAIASTTDQAACLIGGDHDRGEAR